MDHNYIKLDGVADQEAGDFSNIGTMAMLQVQAGDRVDLRAYAKYDEGGSQNDLAPAGVIAGLVNAFGFNPTSGESGAVFDLFEQAIGALGLMGDGEGGEPEAYLQYLFFDRDFNFVATPGIGYAYDQVSGLAAVNATNKATKQHEELSLSREFLEDGYLFVFVSNSSQGTSVYFDDLTIDYTMSPIDQTSDYYPFGGLMGSGFERIISKANDFRYQGKEYDKDLQWYDFHARQYDPYLGRFLAADPLMQFASPYNGMGNNPINLIDPTGMGAYNGLHGDPTPETDNDQDDEVNANSNGDTADAWEREVAAHYAMFDQWMSDMNSTYGESFHESRYGVANGSFGTVAHHSYVKTRGGNSFTITVNTYNQRELNGYLFDLQAQNELPYITSKSITRRDPFNAPGQQNEGNSGQTAFGGFDWLNLAAAEATIWGGATSIAVKGARPVYTTVKAWADQVKSGTRFGNRLGYLGLALTATDVAINGFNTSNTLDGFFGAVSFAGVPGAAIGGTYFIGNLITHGITGKTIGQHVDENYYIVPSGLSHNPVFLIPKN